MIPTPKYRHYPVDVDDEDNSKPSGYCQWATDDGIRHFPITRSVTNLDPGLYNIKESADGKLYFEKTDIKAEDILLLPDSFCHKVVDEIKLFWSKKEKYRTAKLAYKRGILLYGPPGSGKSSIILLAMLDIVERGGVVINFTSPYMFKHGLKVFREIQPHTPLIVLMEDIDAIVKEHEESEVVNILDGVGQAENIIFLATTNYPEVLAERLLNRPSRFDKRFHVPAPSAKARKAYLEHLLHKFNDKEIDIDKWIHDTDNMSIAHVKELFVSVCILDQKYDEVINNLRNMVEEKPKSKDDDDGFGFLARKRR